MLGICSQEELDEEELIEEEVVAEPDEPILSGACLLGGLQAPGAQADSWVVHARRGRGAGEAEADQEQDSRRRQDVAPLFRAPVRPRLAASCGLSADTPLVRSEESESVSELKNVTGSTKLPYGALANGAEGIKDSITNFSEARKSDIDNEHLPPDLIDPSTDGDSSISDMDGSSSYDPRASIGSVGSMGATSLEESDGTRSPSPATSPVPGQTQDSASGRFRKGHGRQSSLGTTMTSPSTRRRSLENTISLIREAMSKEDSSMGAPFFTCCGRMQGMAADIVLAEQRNSRTRSPGQSRRAALRRRATRSPARPEVRPPRDKPGRQARCGPAGAWEAQGGARGGAAGEGSCAATGLVSHRMKLFFTI